MDKERLLQEVKTILNQIDGERFNFTGNPTLDLIRYDEKTPTELLDIGIYEPGSRILLASRPKYADEYEENEIDLDPLHWFNTKEVKLISDILKKQFRARRNERY